MDKPGKEARTSRRQFIAASGALAGGALIASPAGAAPLANKRTAFLKPKPKQQYYLLGAVINNSFYDAPRAALKDFAQMYGVKASLIGPVKLNTSQQFAAFQQAINKPGTAAMVTASIDFNAMKQAHIEALKKNIPVINWLNEWGRPRTSFVGQDEPPLAVAVGDILSSALKGKGKIGVVINTDPATTKRYDAFAKQLQTDHPGIRIAGKAVLQDLSAAGVTKGFDDFYQAHRDIDGLFWAEGNGGIAASYVHDRAPNLKLVLSDIGVAQLTAVKKKQALAAVGVSTYDTAFYAMVAAYMSANGFRVPDSEICADFAITPGNVDAYSKRPYRRGKLI